MSDTPMFIPEEPIILPRPKLVECPRCHSTWYWRTWWKGNPKITCTSCRFGVVPVEVKDTPGFEDHGGGIRAVKCPSCDNIQWYRGTRMTTSCTNSQKCGKKNINTTVATYDEIRNRIKRAWPDLSEEEQKYYSERLEELEGIK